MSQLLYRLIESEHYDALLAVVYLSRYAGHIGIHHYLCTKLKQLTDAELEFYLPQLCHLCVTVDNSESVALEEFLLELCGTRAHGALLTFWLLQTYLRDTSVNPQSSAFKRCHRMYNKVQSIVFGNGERKKEPLQANVFPITLLTSLIFGSIAAPFLPSFAGPLAIAQARKPPEDDETLPQVVASAKLSRSKTLPSEERLRRRRERAAQTSKPNTPTTPAPASAKSPRLPQSPSSTTRNEARSYSLTRRSSATHLSSLEVPKTPLSSTSLPDLTISESRDLPLPAPPKVHKKRKPRTPSRALSRTPEEERVQRLKSNYFRKETQFLAALEDISNRLVAVPKQARLSALRAELALLEQGLPSEVDIPMICPAAINSNGRTSHHRVVRVNPAEATVLNSAERVPYLLMIEVLRDDFDFEPNSKENEDLLAGLSADPESDKRRYFDLSESLKFDRNRESEAMGDSVFEPVQGDIGTSPLISEFPEDTAVQSGVGGSLSNSQIPRLSSGTSTQTTSPLATPRSSDTIVPRTGSPAGSKANRNSRFGPEQQDLSTFAIHMRMAANMLTQLNASSSKRPKHEVEAIKNKIIASMQMLEEKSFFDDSNHIQTFDTIIANASASAVEGPDGNPVNAEAGIARMENDQKTSGVERIADRDDPSAATFGEEWTAKRERIRRSSPYGLCKNWDLLSVIVKTGADLRQEAFACQLIAICGKIWEKAGVPVWIKNMRILVTGESCGLIETITNGTSLHSLKRSLTLAMERARPASAKSSSTRAPIATLKDHFVKTFGKPDTDTYAAAQDAFMRSLVAYSIISYVLQLKDRHNGNILVDNQGHIIHIDFGFMLSNSPGSLGFESAPFKLTQEYVDVLGGVDSPKFQEFRTLCKRAFQALRKAGDNLVLLVELMGKGSKMPCFQSGSEYATAQLRQRFQLHLSEAEAEVFVDEQLINKSNGNYYTRAYDAFQYLSQGIY